MDTDDSAIAPQSRLCRQGRRLLGCLPRALVIFSACTLLLILGVWGLAQSSRGRDLLAQQASRLLSRATGWTVRLEGLQPGLPRHLGFRRLSAADTSGVWLELDDVYAQLQPTAMLRGRVRVETLSCRRVALHRLPVANAGDTRGAVSDAEFPDVAIGALHIAEVDIAPAVIALPSRLQLRGYLRPTPSAGGLEAALQVRLLDLKGQGRVNAAISTDDAGVPIVHLDLAWSESDPFLSRLAGLPQMSPMTIQAVCEGPAAALDVELELTGSGGNAAGLSGTVQSRDNGVLLALDGTVHPHAWPLPDAPATVVPATIISWDLQGEILGNAVTLTRAGAWTETDRLTVSGSFDMAAQTGEATLDLEVADLAAWPLPPAARAQGNLDVRAAVSRSPDGATVLRLSAAAGDLAWASWTVREPTVAAVWHLRSPMTLDRDALPEGTFTIEGRLAELFTPVNTLPAPVQDMTWTLRGRTGPDALHVDSLSVGLPWLELSGRLDWDILREVLSTDLSWHCGALSLVPSLEARGVAGALTAHTTAVVPTTSGPASISAGMTWADPEVGGVALQPGPDAAVQALFEGTWYPGDPLDVSRLEVTAGRNRLSANGHVDPAARLARLQVSATCPTLGDLQPLWPHAPEGAWDGRGDLTLTPRALSLGLDWKVTELAWGGSVSPAATGTWRATWADPFSGALPRISLQAQGTVAVGEWAPSAAAATYEAEAEWTPTDRVVLHRLQVTSRRLQTCTCRTWADW
jgi:hypothetical protein